VPEDGFADVAQGATHEAAVDCVVWWQIARGRAPGTYGPTEAVTRGQMATFLAALVERSGGTLPARTRSAFPDDDGSPHEAAIDRLAAAGVVGGYADGSFRPGLPVTRAQMASFLVRAYEYRSRRTLERGPDAFRDDDRTTHEARIDTAAHWGFTGGTTPTTYGPDLAVRRDQMATFLARVLDLLVVRDGARTP
jgi:hypothetical protein